MTPEKEKELEQHLEAIAALLYEETEPEQVESLAKIEATVRELDFGNAIKEIG